MDGLLDGTDDATRWLVFRLGSRLAACARPRCAQLQAFRDQEGITEAEMFARVRKSTDENELAQMSMSGPPPPALNVEMTPRASAGICADRPT